MRLQQIGSTTDNIWLQDLRHQASKNEEYQQLKNITVNGFHMIEEVYQSVANINSSPIITSQSMMALLHMVFTY